MHVFLQAFASMLSQKYLGFASIGKYALQAFKFASFSTNLQIWFCSPAFVISGFASFSKLSQGFANGFSQRLASAKIMVFANCFVLVRICLLMLVIPIYETYIGISWVILTCPGVAFPDGGWGLKIRHLFCSPFKTWPGWPLFSSILDNSWAKHFWDNSSEALQSL